MRLLVLADEPPAADVRTLAERDGIEAVVTLGDLTAATLGPLDHVRLPRLGVHGNHDAPGTLVAGGIEDVHLRQVEIGGWTFAGFQGCPRYHGRGGDGQPTQRQASRLARRLPAADVLVCHAPPRGLGDEPGDPAHVGFDGLRRWVDEHEPRYVLHGHTTPDPRTRVHRLGRTEVVWVKGARTVELRRP